MRTSTEIQKDIDDLQKQLRDPLERLAFLSKEIAESKSHEFIAANGIKRGDVQMSSGADVPWFSDVWRFANWCAKNTKKKWAEWNGRIYLTSDLKEGRMPDSPAEVEHLKD